MTEKSIEVSYLTPEEEKADWDKRGRQIEQERLAGVSSGPLNKLGGMAARFMDAMMGRTVSTEGGEPVRYARDEASGELKGPIRVLKSVNGPAAEISAEHDVEPVAPSMGR